MFESATVAGHASPTSLLYFFRQPFLFGAAVCLSL